MTEKEELPGRGLAPLYVPAPRWDEISKLQDLLDSKGRYATNILVDAFEKCITPVTVARELIAGLGDDPDPVAVKDVLDRASESEDPMPANCLVAQATVGALVHLDSVAGSDVQTDRRDLVRLFMSLPYYAQASGFCVYAPSWWPDLDHADLAQTIEYRRREAVRNRIETILEGGTTADPAPRTKRPPEGGTGETIMTKPAALSPISGTDEDLIRAGSSRK